MKNSFVFLTFLSVVSFVSCGAPEEEPQELDLSGAADLYGDATRTEECDYDIDCSEDDGLICRPTERDPDEPKNQCLEPATAGAPCEEIDDCMEGLICGESYALLGRATLACIEAEDALPKKCYFDWQCEDENDVCRPHSTEDDRCQLPGGIGESCDEEDDCLAALSCIEETALLGVVVKRCNE